MSTAAVREFAAGAALLGRGWRVLRAAPGLLVLGALPALIATVLLVAGLAALVLHLGELAAGLSPFADDWAAPWRELARALLAVVLLGIAGLTGLVLFAALTLLVGGPFYERIAEAVDDARGGPAQPDRGSRAVQLLRGVRDSAVLVAASVGAAVPLFLAGFLPVFGQTVVPVLAVCVGAWLVLLEMVGPAFSRRGLRLADRHRGLRTRPARALGLGVPVYLLCAVPLAATVVFPVGFVGATLLAREVLSSDEPGEPAE